MARLAYEISFLGNVTTFSQPMYRLLLDSQNGSSLHIDHEQIFHLDLRDIVHNVLHRTVSIDHKKVRRRLASLY